MNLLRALRFDLSSSAPIVAFTGAGGKTTALFQLAREMQSAIINLSRAKARDRQSKIIVTATSHLSAQQIPLADKHIVGTRDRFVPNSDISGVTLFTGEIEDEKTSPIDLTALKRLCALSRNESIPLLIEADGSRQRPLKAPADHEPPIPDFVDAVVVVAGLSGIGKPLDDESVHRPEFFSKLSGLQLGDTVTPQALTRVLARPEGGLKNIPASARRILLLNQADTPELQSIARGMSAELLKTFHAVIVASIISSSVYAVYEKVAGIVLAAGESKRFGKPKQLLDWRGQPFVRAVAQTALSAGLSPVVVVTGAHAEQVEGAVNDLGVKIIRNDDWRSGQSSSVKAGVRALDEFVGAGIFLLADQPQIGAEVIRSLVESHLTETFPIVAPLVLNERRANPVLFDRVTFHDLLELSGDVGGRALFSKYKVEYMPWHDDGILLDVDKVEDYQALLRSQKSPDF